MVSLLPSHKELSKLFELGELVAMAKQRDIKTACGNQQAWSVAVEPRLAFLRDLQLVEFGPRLDGLFTARESLADGLQAHSFGGQLVELLDLARGPRLAMAFEVFGHGFLRFGEQADA